MNTAIIIQIHEAVYGRLKEYEVPTNNADLAINNSQSFKYKATLLGKTADYNDGKNFAKNAKIVVTLKYLSNFWRALEIALINCKIYLELNWIENCILSCAGDSTKLAIADGKLHVPIVTLSTKDCKFGKTIKRRI